jgi:hypothetical protein
MLAEKNESGSRQTVEDEARQRDQAALKRSAVFVGKVALVTLTTFFVLGFFIGVILYNVVDPATSTQWKDLMQALGYLMAALAAISAGLAAVFGVYATWQNIDRQLERARENTLIQLESTRENTFYS